MDCATLLVLRLPFALNSSHCMIEYVPVFKKRLFLAIKILVFLAVCLWVGKELVKSWDQIKGVQWEPNYLLLVLSGLCYIVAYVPAAIYWRFVMKTLGQKPGRYETFRAYYIGHLGKYIPGKAGVMVIRAGLLNHERTTLPAAAASVFVETMTMMAVGAFVAALTMLLWFQHIEDSQRFTLLALGMVFCTALPILPPVFHFATKRLKKFQIELKGLRFRTLASGWLLNIPLWIMLGFSLWLTMLGFGMKSESILAELPFCTLAISVSIVIGFASMLPGGFGTRELSLAYFLTLFFTTHPVGDLDPNVFAIVIAAVYRIISILAELITSAMLTVFSKRKRP